MRWGMEAISCTLVGVALVGWAAWLYHDESIGWAIAAGIGGVVLLVSGFMLRSSVCPDCGAEIKVVAISGSVHRCASCDRYYRLQQGKLSPVAANAIEVAPSFAVRLDHLGEPSSWVWPKPECCCVCGAPAIRLDDFRVTLGTGYAAAGLMVQTTTWTLRIPYCAEHRDGIANGSDFDSENISHPAILFRSMAYCRVFREANGIARH